NGLPQMVSVGAMDMANFGPYASVPETFAGRNFYKHNPTVTLMRTTKDENRQISEVVAEKSNQTPGHTTMMLPRKGLSGLDVDGQPFDGTEEDQMLLDTIKERRDTQKVDIVEMNVDINDVTFAEAAAEKLIQLIERTKTEGK